jgi:hypothetical protein
MFRYLFLLPKRQRSRYSERHLAQQTPGGQLSMPKPELRWLTAQETAAILDSTSAEICRLLKLGRLTGVKRKQPGRAGKAQWLVNPQSIAKEKKRTAKS